MSTKLLDLWVGLFVVLGIGALLFLALRVSGLDDLGNGDGYVISARFDNIGGLRSRAPVTVAGVRIGRVTDIVFDDSDYKAVVRMQIGDRYQKLPSDSLATIRTAGLLGEQYISMEPGADESYLKPGDEIVSTQSAFVLEQVIGQFLYNAAQTEK